jgi:hypothetical protein
MMTLDRKRMRNAVVLLIGLTTLHPAFVSTQSPAHTRNGPVRADGRAVRDAAGPFNALGATLFWGAWGYKFDRARLERNLAVLSAAGVDYVRVLGSVGGPSWEDRQTDPRWSDYDAIIAGMTDLAYDRYGLRVQWTLFGGAPYTPPGAARAKLVDRFSAMAKGREHKLFAFEIANEAWQNGFEGPGGVAELRRLGRRLNNRTTVLVALSSPAADNACEIYAGARAEVMTLHYKRNFEDDGPTTPLRLPWSAPSAFDRDCRGQLPAVIFNNEPIGPESSVEEDDSPSRIAAGYVMTFLAGNASYVLHTGPGVRGGGKADVAGVLQRHANFDELPSFDAIAAALKAAKRYLPQGLAKWTRHSSNQPAVPLQGPGEILYVASSGSRFVGLVLGTGETIVRARTNASVAVRQTATGKLLERLDVESGEDIRLNGDEPLVLVGHRRVP